MYCNMWSCVYDERVMVLVWTASPPPPLPAADQPWADPSLLAPDFRKTLASFTQTAAAGKDLLISETCCGCQSLWILIFLLSLLLPLLFFLSKLEPKYDLKHSALWSGELNVGSLSTWPSCGFQQVSAPFPPPFQLLNQGFPKVFKLR